MNTNTTPDINRMRSFTRGATTVHFHATGDGVTATEIHVRTRNVLRTRLILGPAAAAEYLAAHPALQRAFVAATRDLPAEIAAWKHLTPHHRYDCDGGCLAVRVNDSVVVRVQNGYGDGDHPVYVIADGTTRLPPEFIPAGTIINGPCTLDVMAYDCGDLGGVLERVTVTTDATFYRGESGAIAIVVR